jgi:hypothetical protein
MKSGPFCKKLFESFEVFAGRNPDPEIGGPVANSNE